MSTSRLTKKLGRRVFGRGEGIIARSGLALAVLLLAGVAGLSWWVHEQQRTLLEDERRARVAQQLELLAMGAATLSNEQDLSALRRLAVEMARDEAVASARVMLGDGRAIAASEPAQIQVVTLPGDFPALDPVLSEGARLVNVPGRGTLVASVRPAPTPAPMAWELPTGVAAAGALGLSVLLLVYRRLRERLGVLAAVTEALWEASEGETRAEALRLSEDLGPEARAWNALLCERESLREQLAQGRVEAALESGVRGPGDLQEACDALWQGLVVLDEKLRVRYANGAAGVFLQTRREQLIGTDIGEVVGEPSLLEALRSVAEGETRRRRSIEVERAGESSGVLRCTVRPLRSDDSASAMLLIEDVTQQRVAAESRRGFVAQATHELRTPLTNIRLYAEEALELGEGEVQERSRCLNVINQEVRRLERIVADMLSVSEMEAGTMQIASGDVRLERVMEELAEDYQAQARSKNISLSFDLPPKYPVFHADRDKLALVMHNLLGNALKYTPEGGEVQVRVAADELQLRFEVRDSGIGIGEEDQQRIFEPFYRARDKRIEGVPGTGLGLSLAREMVRLHGGELSVESAPEKGSTFTFTVPNGRAGDERAMAA